MTAPMPDPVTTLPAIADVLRAQFGDTAFLFQESYGMLSMTLSVEAYPLVVAFLHRQGFHMLTSLCGIHYPQAERPFGVVLHLHDLASNVRIRVKCFAKDATHPTLPTLTHVFSGANWMEREAYDFYGIVFEGHPNLIRILNDDSMTNFPMRKEFPLEDQSRLDKDDRMFGR